MDNKRVSIITTISIAIIFAFTVFAAAKTTPGNMWLSNYLNFVWDARMATDVVVAEFVAQESVGLFTQSEFIVRNRILGNAPDRIFVYQFDLFELTGRMFHHFAIDTQYLLILRKVNGVYVGYHEDGFMLSTNHAPI